MKPTDPPPPGGHGAHTGGDRGPLPHGAQPGHDPRRRQGGYDDGVARHPRDVHDAFDNVDVAHEHSDVDTRAIMTSAGIVAAVVAVAMVAMYLLFGWFEHRAVRAQPYVSPLAAPPTEMPRTTMDSPFFSEAAGGVPLLTDEPSALERHRATERQRLHTYGWANEAAGVAHIPIDEAKKLLIERGLPSREFYPVDPSLGTRLPAMGGSSSGRAITGMLPEPDDGDVHDEPQADDQPGDAAIPAPPGTES